MSKLRFKALALLGQITAGTLLLAAGPAFAAPVTFFGEDLGLGESTPLSSFPNATAARDDFLSHLTGVGTEDFEGFADGTGTPLNITFPGSSGNITATLNGNGAVNVVSAGSTNGNGRYATSGTHYWEASDVFSINFDTPVSAFGFFGIDIGDFAGQVTATLADGTSTLINIPNTISGPGGSVLFWGVIDPTGTFTSVTFGNTAAGVDAFGFDDMVVGDLQQIRIPVPEPGTLALFAVGLLGLLLMWRRRTV